MKTVLEIVNTIALRVGINSTNTATNSTDQQIRQLTALVSQAGQNQASRFDWQVLTNEKSFSAVAALDQGTLIGDIFSDADGFDKLTNETMYNRTTRLPIWGPNSPQKRQMEAAMYQLGPYTEYFIRNGHLYFSVIPTAGHQIYCEFKTKNWVEASGGSFKTEFTADDDVPLLDDQLLILESIWLWKSAKGFDYAEDMRTAEIRIADAMAKDGSNPTLSLRFGERNDVFGPGVFVPAGSWGQ